MNKKSFKPVLSGMLAVLIFSAACTLPAEAAENAPNSAAADFTVRIVHTNDIHARIEEDAKSGIIGVERLKTIIDSYTAGCDLSLVLDSGDLYHGLPIATVCKGESVAELVNALDYDAMTAGNHDWNYGEDRLKELADQSGLKMLTGNAVTTDGQPFFDDEFLIKSVQKDGRTLNVGVFGVTDPGIFFSPFDEVRFTDAQTYSNNAAKTLRERGCDIVIALSHALTPADLAENVSGVDMWLCGHEHMRINTTVTAPDGGTALVCEDESYLYSVGCYEIDVQADGDGFSCEYTSSPCTYSAAVEFEKDAGVTALLNDVRERQNQILNENAGYSPADLDGVWEHLRTGETNLGRAVTSAYLHLTGADIAFENAGGIRASIKKGDLTYGDIIAVSPYGNVIITKRMKGADILAMLENSIALELKNIEADESGEYDAWPSDSGFYLQTGGIRVTYDPSLEEGKRILSAYVGAEPLEKDKFYTVAANNYLAGCDDLPLLRDAEQIDEFLACDEALISYFSQDAETISRDIEQERMVRAFEALRGDVDGDGQVTIVDATWIQRFLAEFQPEKAYNPAAADADGNGTVTIDDVSVLQRFLADMEAPEGIGKPLA